MEFDRLTITRLQDLPGDGVRPAKVIVANHRIVAEVDRRLSLVAGVEAEVDANLKRAQSLRKATLSKAFGLAAKQ